MVFGHLLGWQIPRIRDSDIKTTNNLFTHTLIFEFAG